MRTSLVAILVIISGLANGVLADSSVEVPSIGAAKAMEDGACVRISGKVASTGKHDFALGAPAFNSGVATGHLESPLICEASGVAASRQNVGVFWVHNDSGDSARIFAIDATGKYLGTYNLSDVTAIDFEDIAIGPGPVPGKSYIYVGDIGDNNNVRPYVIVYRFEEPTASSAQSPVAVGVSDVQPVVLVYPDYPFNSETLMVDPVTCDIYVVTKKPGTSRLYRAPAEHIASGGDVVLEYIGDLPFATATGGDISPSGDEMIVRSKPLAYLWKRPPGSRMWNVLRGTAYSVPLANEAQGEAICYAPDGKGYYTVSEGVYSPIYYYARQATQTASSFYMQEPEGFTGILVTPDGETGILPDRGDTVNLAGRLATTSNGERSIVDAAVEITSVSDSMPPAFGIPGRSVGGSDWRCSGLSTCGQRGVADGVGLNNIGNVVRTWGKVIETDPSGSCFSIDEGSGKTLRVAFDGRTYTIGAFLVITGISSCYTGGDGLLHSLVLVRDAHDIICP